MILVTTGSLTDLPALFRIARVVLLAASLLLYGCGAGDTGAQESIQTSTQREHLVEVAEVQRESVGYSVVRTGTLRARREVRLHTQEEGRIVELPYYEGDRVEEGAVVARMDDALLKAQLDQARATRLQAEADRDRLSSLARNRLVSEDDLARAETAVQVARAEEDMLRTRLEYAVIQAPFTGVVSARLAEPGDALPRHTHLMTLIDPDSLLTQVTVSELLMPILEPGDEVQVQVDALGDRRYPGRILRIHPAVDARTRQGVVEVLVAPVPTGARPGQLCRVTLTAPSHERLLIPFSALRRDERGEYVYRVADSVAERMPVRSGLRIDDRVEILEGLAAGDRVVTRGFLGLTADKQVQTVNGPPG
jgi:RND family efflux transporter MFP subunit